jgi:formate--tetrahydrofolate ligase
MEIKSDIEIAQACEKKKIAEIAAEAGVDEKYLEQYGNYKAKVDLRCCGIWRTDPTGSWCWSRP